MSFTVIHDEEAKRLIKATDMALALHDIQEYLRGVTKYDKLAEYKTEDAIDMIVDEFWDILAQHSIDLEDILS